MDWPAGHDIWSPITVVGAGGGLATHVCGSAAGQQGVCVTGMTKPALAQDESSLWIVESASQAYVSGSIVAIAPHASEQGSGGHRSSGPRMLT